MSWQKQTSTTSPAPDVQSAMPESRGYQIELLQESIARNIIIALPTGSGKTHIAVLRIKYYLDLQSEHKVAWFVCPTVALSEQQFNVISLALPAAILITGRQEPEKWTSTSIWLGLLRSHSCIISTPQVLLDALSHGFISLQDHIGLLVFDEAHHATGHHPYNRIMQIFYHPLNQRPDVLGLTASPVCGVQVSEEIRTLERNLGAVVRVPLLHNNELAHHTNTPTLRYSTYEPSWDVFSPGPLPVCLQWCRDVIASLDIEEDPWVINGRKKLQELDRHKTSTENFERNLANVIAKKATFTLKSLRRLETTACEMHWSLGEWAVERYLQMATTQVSFSSRRDTWSDKELEYLLSVVSRIRSGFPPSTFDISDAISPKVRQLLKTLLDEYTECENSGTPFVGLLFATRRDVVIMLERILSTHPATKDIFRCGCLIGSSTNAKRETLFDLDQRRNANLELEQQMILSKFRGLEINLLIATSVAEEGLDIPACGAVIRFDAPANLRSWIQSQGRARRQRSTYSILIDQNFPDPSHSYQSLKAQMEEQCRKEREQLQLIARASEMEGDAGSEDSLKFVNEKTGATLTQIGAISHLEYFCQTLPRTSYTVMSAQYDYYPPQEYVLLANGAAELPAPKGPFKATVTLPSQLPPTLRCFTTDRTHSSKISAKRQVAFEACIALFREGLLNDHFLPHKFTRHGGEEHITALMKDIEKRSGLAPVVHQLDPWVVQPPNQNPEWHFILVSIGDKGMLKMFSKSTLLSELDQPAILSLFDTGEAQRVVFDYQHKLEEREFDHHLAIKFTRALFWATWSSNMDWESTDYPYLFLPLNLEVSDKLSKDQPGELLIPSQHLSFGETLPPFPWHAKGKNGARFFIRGSRTQALDDNEISVVMKFHNLREPPRSIEYVLEGSYFPKRSNFLLSPTQASQPLRKRDRQKLLLLPSHLSVDLVSGWLLQASMMLPSALEGLSHSLIAGSLQRKYFKTDLLCNVPRHLLLNAILASSVNAQQNYQRLETLGDSVLKLVASLSLLERHPQWHEGYLSRAKDHIVSNSSLAKASLSEGLAAFIIRRQFAGKKWAPSCLGGQANAKRKKITAEMLSSKILADVVESLIGACYMSVGLDGGVAFLRRILPQKDIAWHKPAECVQRINERTEAVLRVPRQIENVEKAIGWSFKRKRHILEALTHGSHQQATEQVLSYERMEFLGDAVLDFIVTSRTYLASEESFGPALLYKSKIALVNADLLGYLCFDIRVIGLRSTTRKVDNAYELEETEDHEYFWKYLYHSSPTVLDSQAECLLRYNRYRPAIHQALSEGSEYPWTELAGLQLPKLYSDMIESILGAVYLDSGGDIEACTEMLRRIGLLRILERVENGELQIRHPITVVQEWAALNQSVTYGYLLDERAGMVRCRFVVDQEVIATEELAGNGPAVLRALRMRCAASGMQALGL